MAYMIFKELHATRLKLLVEKDKQRRDILNAHFDNIVEVLEE